MARWNTLAPDLSLQRVEEPATALQFALEEQRRRAETLAHWREEDEDDRKHRAQERAAEEDL